MKEMVRKINIYRGGYSHSLELPREREKGICFKFLSFSAQFFFFSLSFSFQYILFVLLFYFLTNSFYYFDSTNVAMGADSM